MDLEQVAKEDSVSQGAASRVKVGRDLVVQGEGGPGPGKRGPGAGGEGQGKGDAGKRGKTSK